MSGDTRKLELLIANLEARVKSLEANSLPASGGSEYAMIGTEADDRMIRLGHDNLDTYPDAVGYINAQRTNPLGGTTGAFDHGGYWDATHFCFMVCYVGHIDFYISDGASARYALEMSYNLANFNVPIDPATLTDAAAPNNSIYYSSTQSKLVFKDSGGTVRALY